MAKSIKGYIDGKAVEVNAGETILSVARRNNIEIPTLCHLKEFNEVGFCRLCVVEVEGQKDLISSCDTPFEDGMVITTNSKNVENSRKSVLSLLASKHRFNCFVCPKESECTFYDRLSDQDVEITDFGSSKGRNIGIIDGPAIVQDLSKCVVCKKCVSVCANVSATKTLKFHDDLGADTFVSPTKGLTFAEDGCINCGACLKVCPTGTLQVKDDTAVLKNLLKGDENTVIAQVSYETIYALTERDKVETFEERLNIVLELLETLGFDYHISLDLGTNMVIEKQAKALKKHLESGSKTPLIASDYSFAKYIENFADELIPNLFSGKSEHLSQAVAIRNVICEEKGLDVSKVKIVSILPTIGAKEEILRDDNKGLIDLVITTNELALLRRNVKFNNQSKARIGIDTSIKKLTIKPLIEGYEKTNPTITDAVVNEVFKAKLSFQPIDDKKFSKLSIANINGKGIIKAETGTGAKQLVKYLSETAGHNIVYVVANGTTGGSMNGSGQPLSKEDFFTVLARRNKLAAELKAEVRTHTSNDELNAIAGKVADDMLKTSFKKNNLRK